MLKFPQTLPTSDHVRKLTATHRDEDFVSEWQLFSILDTLPPTATGLDHLPAWFLRLGAPVFSKKPLAMVNLFNNSLTTSTVPLQWKRAFIQPVPKTASPLVHSDLVVTGKRYTDPSVSILKERRRKQINPCKHVFNV